MRPFPCTQVLIGLFGHRIPNNNVAIEATRDQEHWLCEHYCGTQNVLLVFFTHTLPLARLHTLLFQCRISEHRQRLLPAHGQYAPLDRQYLRDLTIGAFVRLERVITVAVEIPHFNETIGRARVKACAHFVEFERR